MYQLPYCPNQNFAHRTSAHLKDTTIASLKNPAFPPIISIHIIFINFSVLFALTNHFLSFFHFFFLKKTLKF